MPQVTYIVDGERHTTDLPAGERLLNGAYKLSLDEKGYGECGGNCVCSTCHVRVVSGGEAFPAPSNDEAGLLDTVPNAGPASRLSCQLVIQPGQGPVVVEWLGRG